MKSNNPFPTYSYNLPKYFCDRQKELEQLTGALANGRNVVLLSLRRMGKTGLIKHLFYKLKSDKNIQCFYFDIMDTKTPDDFVNMLANSLIGSSDNKSGKIFDKVLQFFSKLNPVISINPETGAPSIELKHNTIEQSKTTITSIFNYLEQQKKRVYIAIDEFQQITQYKETSFEAFLRSRIQHLQNINFIFSGSQQHILMSMFGNYSKPFYQSADFLKLDRINKEVYCNFIVKKFAETNKKVSKEIVLDLLDWTDIYTFYVQNTCNKLWYISDKQVSTNDLKQTKETIINEKEYFYSNLKNLFNSSQYKLLESIAINNGVKQPTAKDFIKKFNLGTPSTINSSLKALIEKEYVYKENNEYKVYDIFLIKWIQKNN